MHLLYLTFFDFFVFVFVLFLIYISDELTALAQQTAVIANVKSLQNQMKAKEQEVEEM